MAKDLEEALINIEAKLIGAEKPHMDLGGHLDYIESLLGQGAGGSGSGSGSDVGIVELTDSQAQTLSADNKITFTTEQAEIIKTHQLIIVRYGSAIEYKGFVSRIYTQGQADAYTIFMFLDYILFSIAITDFTAEQTLNSVTFPISYTFSYDDSVNALIWSDGDYDRLVHLSTINGNPIAFNNASDAKNYSFTEDKTISLFGKHSILVPENSSDTSILPCTTSDNGKVLSVVNGEAQWATPTGGGGGGKSVPPTLVLFDMNTGGMRTTITEEEYNNLVNGLYNQVMYGPGVDFGSVYSPSKLFFTDGVYAFTQFKISVNADETYSYSSMIVNVIEIGEKNTSNEYPITVTEAFTVDPSSAGGGGGLTKIQCKRKDYHDLTKGGTVDISTLPTDVPFILEVGMDGVNSAGITYRGKLEFLMCYYHYDKNDGSSKKTWIGYAGDMAHCYIAYIKDGQDVAFLEYMDTNAGVVNIKLPTKDKPITTATSFNANALLSNVLTIQNHNDIYLFGSYFTKFRSPVYSDTNGTLYYYIMDYNISDLSTVTMKYIEIQTTILPLPADASTSTYVLKAVNGIVQWVKEV